jgi:hypothetical protein
LKNLPDAPGADPFLSKAKIPMKPAEYRESYQVIFLSVKIAGPNTPYREIP